MKRTVRTSSLAAVVWLIATVALNPSPARAHCDGMDGPVVQAAQKALDSSNVNLVLIWVQKSDEAEIERAFKRALAVRKLGPEAHELADTYFFETLVRVHRAGEGAPYTGLKPAGRDLGPAIPAGDKALETGDIEVAVNLLTDRVAEGVRRQFANASQKRSFAPHDVAAGRDFVRAYVEYIHYLERIYQATTSPVQGHFSETEAHANEHTGH